MVGTRVIEDPRAGRERHLHYVLVHADTSNGRDCHLHRNSARPKHTYDAMPPKITEEMPAKVTPNGTCVHLCRRWGVKLVAAENELRATGLPVITSNLLST